MPAKIKINNLDPNAALLEQSLSEFQGAGPPAEAVVRFGIGNIKSHLTDRFATEMNVAGEIDAIPFTHFGLIVEYQRERELTLFDEAYNLNQNVKDLIAKFGFVAVKNVRLNKSDPKEYQKNIFPSLDFHIDRGANFDNQYSLFYRNPADPEHRLPRTTSSLITPTAVVGFQAQSEGVKNDCWQTLQAIFINESPEPAFGKYILAQPWDGAAGMGELCLFDNRTVMHASYGQGEKGYKISVQYLY